MAFPGLIPSHECHLEQSPDVLLLVLFFIPCQLSCLDYIPPCCCLLSGRTVSKGERLSKQSYLALISVFCALLRVLSDHGSTSEGDCTVKEATEAKYLTKVTLPPNTKCLPDFPTPGIGFRVFPFVSLLGLDFGRQQPVYSNSHRQFVGNS